MTDELTRVENASIREFVQSAADDGYLTGRVLDYGAGRMPYRDIVIRAGGQYFPYDDPSYPNSMAKRLVGKKYQEDAPYDAILCNQVIQYMDDPLRFLKDFRGYSGPTIVRPGGHLVMTYPTNWPEVQVADLYRYTKTGMETLLDWAGFNVVKHDQRATILGVVFRETTYEQMVMSGDGLALGYGVVARA